MALFNSPRERTYERAMGSRTNPDGSINMKRWFSVLTWEQLFRELARSEAQQRDAFNKDEVINPLIEELRNQGFESVKEVYNYINRKGSDWKIDDGYGIHQYLRFTVIGSFPLGESNIKEGYCKLDADGFPYIYERGITNGTC